MNEGANGADAGSEPGRQAADLAEAVAVARGLLRHIAMDAAADVSDDSAAILRRTDDVLARLAPPATRAVAPAAPFEASGPEHRIVVDVTDLLSYFQTNRLPTGIQRVQSEVIYNIIKAEASHGGRLCCFEEARGDWIEVDAARFMALCAQARLRGDPQEPRWRASIRDINESIAANSAMIFPEGAILINVGTSWWLPNYFIYVRKAKAAAKVRYVPLIHDLIPILAAEYCDDELVGEFIGWFIGVLDHADFLLANSEATKRDILDVAARLGRPVSEDRIAVMTLDADFRAAELQALPASRRFAEPFVLFVSTLEARKNQLGLLDAWTTLVAKHGAEKIPRLVLVGKRGFQSDIILGRLDMNPDLRDRVSILSGLEDAELQALYRDCLFTVYPSFHEGWGLPVTESLCYGKVPLVADNSSLLEAGGEWALYFRTGSPADMLRGLERLIFEDGFRKQREAVIAETFRPRLWSDITGKVVERVEAWAATAADGWRPPTVRPSTYYPLSRIRGSRVRPGLGTAEAFRRGLGWHGVAQDDGAAMRPTGAELEMRVDADVVRIGFELVCSKGATARYRIEVEGEDRVVEGEAGGETSTWAFLDLTGGDDRTVQFRFSSVLIQSPADPVDPAGAADPAIRRRRPGLALKGFFAFGSHPTARIDFLEAAALGALSGARA